MRARESKEVTGVERAVATMLLPAGDNLGQESLSLAIFRSFVLLVKDQRIFRARARSRIP